MRPRIESLAAELYRAGAGAPIPRWERDDALHAWWVEPGRVLGGEYPGHPDLDRARGKLGLLVAAGIRTIVDLTTQADPLDAYQDLLDEIGRHRDVQVVRHNVKIPDVDVTDHGTYDQLVQTIHHAAAGGGVYVHCWGGVGRTGTVIGCLLAEDGDLDHHGVLARLQELRAGTGKATRSSPETPAQVEIIRARVSDRRPT